MSNIKRTHTPVDTERKLNAHKTFNLRPVSTGMGHHVCKGRIFAEFLKIRRILELLSLQSNL